MKRNLLLLVFCFLSGVQLFSQRKTVNGAYASSNSQTNVARSVDTLKRTEIDVQLSGKTAYTDYKVISHQNDTTIVDTTLTIAKYYKFNFIRKDDFELLPFHNQGQTFNNLAYNFNKTSLFPDIGFRAKQFNYLTTNEVKYYHVPTPTTEIMYRTGLEQGQVLDALFTVNFSKRLNVAIAYKGLRSLGAYRRSLASAGNFRLSFYYKTLKERYTIKGHAVNQDITHQESGGLTPESLVAFLNDDPNFSTNRGRLDVNFNDAESILEGKRLFFEHTLNLYSSKKKKNHKNFSNVKVGHSFIRNSKFFEFKQNTPSDEIDRNRVAGTIANKTNYLLYDNQLFVDFNSKYILGKFRVKAGYTTYNYGYDNPQNTLVTTQNNRLKGNATSFGLDWQGKIKNLQVNASGTITSGSGRLAGNNLYAEALYRKDSIFLIKAKIQMYNTNPNFNFLLHQSNYNKFNWEKNFTTIGTRILGGDIKSTWGNASFAITNIDRYTYFDEEGLPQQYSGTINYLKVKASKEITMGKFSLDNTVMYQKVASGSRILRVPEWVTRNTLYYSDHWFKGNPLLVQIGVTFKYFTNYKANAYHPLLGEFTLQNTTDIGYPTLDLFLNGRVRRTRVYFKADNISSFFFKKNYLSAPNYPYRDFVIRFGVVWNWFI